MRGGFLRMEANCLGKGVFFVQNCARFSESEEGKGATDEHGWGGWGGWRDGLRFRGNGMLFVQNCARFSELKEGERATDKGG